MAFTTKKFNDLRGILFLVLLTIPSIATTNIDCNGKPFHCVNSTHFMICVDLGSGVSSTIDSFIIPCPAPTECRSTNRFECEFPAATTLPPTNEPLAITTDQTTTATGRAIGTTIQFVPEIITTVPFEDLYNTVSTTTISESELSTPNPTFIIDSTTIEVIDNVNVSTSGSYTDVEVGVSADVPNITSSTQDGFSETTVSLVTTNSPVAITSENIINFSQTDSNLKTINDMTTTNLDIAITTTEDRKISTFVTTERVNIITDSKTETDLNSISEQQQVTENTNVTISIQNQAEYTTESLRNKTQVDTASITEISVDQSILADNKDHLRTDMGKETINTITNPLVNELIHAEHTITTLTDLPDKHTVTDAVTKQTTEIYATATENYATATETYATAETLGASSIIPSDLSIQTESIILVDPKTLIENKVLVDQEKQLFSVERGTTETTLSVIPKTNIEMSTQDAIDNYNLSTVAKAIINDSDPITGPSSKLHNAIISSTAPTIDITSITETTTQETFYFIKYTSVTPPSEVNSTTDIGITYQNNNLVDNKSTMSLPSTDSPTLTTDAKIVSTIASSSEIQQNKIVNNSPKTNLKNVSKDLLTLSTTEKIIEFNPSVTEPAISESNIYFRSNIDTQSFELDPALQQLEVSNKSDSNNNVSNLNSQNNILSTVDLNADKQVKSETKVIITEPTFTVTEINTVNNDVNKKVVLVEHNYITPQRENETSYIKTIQTTDSSNDIVSDNNITFEPSLLPVLTTDVYLDAHTPEKAINGPVVIESTITQNDSIASKRSFILPTEATTLYYDVTESNRKTDQLYTGSDTNNITDTINKKATDLHMDKIISELREIDSKRQGTPKTLQNEPIKRQLQERVDINALQKTAEDTIFYSPTIAADGKPVSTESSIFKNEQNKIKVTVVDKTSFENQLTLATTNSILELNPTVTDSTVSESNFLYESSVNVQSPKTLITTTIDIINEHNLNAPGMGPEKSNRVEPKGLETPMAPITIQTQLREIEINTKEPKSILGIKRNIAEYDTISTLPVAESTRNVDFNLPSRTVSPDSVLQSTSSSILENSSKINSASKDLDSMVSTTKTIIDNSQDFIKNTDDNTKYYDTGVLTKSFPSISISGNLDNKGQDHLLSLQKNVDSLETMQYNPNNKSSEGLTILKTTIEQVTTESIFLSQNNIGNLNENPQDNTPNSKNTVANSVKNLDSKILSLNTESVNKPNTQESRVPISENTVINLTSSSTNEIQTVTDNIADSIINQEVQPETPESAIKDPVSMVTIGITKNEPTLPELSSIGDTQNTYINKHNIIKQDGSHGKESVPKELNSAVVNEGKTSHDLTNHTPTSYTDTSSKINTGSYIVNKSFGEFNNKTSTDNSSTIALTLVGKNIDHVENDTNLIRSEKAQPHNKLEDQKISGLVKTASIQTLDIKIVPITTDKTSTLVTNFFSREKDQTLNSEPVLTTTQTSESQQIVSGGPIRKVFKNNGTHSSIVLTKDGYQMNDKKAPEARVKSLAERDISTTSNKSLRAQVESSSTDSQKVDNNAGEADNLATFDILSSAKSGGFEEKTNKPSTEKPDDEETIASGNEGENREINKASSFTTSSSESVTVTTESVEGDNNGNNNNFIVQSNSKYETLTSKPTIETSTRPTQVDNLKNIQQLTIVSEVSTQSTVRSTSQKLSLENNTPLPPTTIAVTNDFLCKFNQRGRFADKHDCRKFYICHGTSQPIKGICPVYTVFSELRKQCTKNLSHCIRNNQFQCVSEGRFSDFLNDNIYYICAKNKLGTFIRFKLRCQNGYHLNKTSVRCALNTETSQSISSAISKSNSEQSAALKVEVKSKDSKNSFECKKEGTFADPDICRVYYVCKKTSKSGYLRKKKKCDSDEYFHKDKKKCVDAESYECK